MGLNIAVACIGVTGALLAYFYLAYAYSYKAEIRHGRNANLYHDRDGTYDPEH